MVSSHNLVLFLRLTLGGAAYPTIVDTINRKILIVPSQLTEKTRQALDKAVSQKIAAAMPVRAADKLAPAQYIR